MWPEFKSAGSFVRRTPQVATFVLLAAASPAFADEGAPLDGRAIAFDREQGNCLACHAMAGGESPGDLGPPLMGMRERYPDRTRLRAQIWDPTENNPASIMPPYGRHRVLTEAEIDAVTDFVHGL